MRRKKRFGVYSNKTIKRCACHFMCKVCKGLCKNDYIAEIDPQSNWHFANSMPIKRTSQIGVGSLLPGRKFVIYDKKHSFKYSYLVKEEMLMRTRRKRDKKEDIFDEIENWKLHMNLERCVLKNEAKFLEN
jgi:hypothetical protein